MLRYGMIAPLRPHQTWGREATAPKPSSGHRHCAHVRNESTVSFLLYKSYERMTTEICSPLGTTAEEKHTTFPHGFCVLPEHDSSFGVQEMVPDIPCVGQRLAGPRTLPQWSSRQDPSYLWTHSPGRMIVMLQSVQLQQIVAD